MVDIPAYNPEQDQELIPAIEPDQQPTPPSYVIEDRAKKASFGLQGKVKETQTDIRNGIANGQEDAIRGSVAAQIHSQNIERRNNIISRYLAQTNQPITPDQIDYIENKLNQPDKPASVFEDHFALQYMGYIDHTKNNPNDTTWVKQAQEDWPTEFDAYKYLGRHSLATTQMLNTRLENISSEIEDESTVRHVWNIAKGMVPGRDEYALSRLVPGSSIGFNLGASLEEQSVNFYRMNNEDQQKTLDQAHEYLKGNPELEATFLSGLIGQSKFTRLFNNLSLPLNSMVLGDVYGIAKGAAKAAFPALRVRDYINDITRSAGALDPAITAPAATGDLARAATNRGMLGIVETVENVNPIRRELEGLQSFLRRGDEDLRENPGNYGAELNNQLQQQREAAGSKVITMLLNMIRNERLPPLRAAEQFMDELKKYAMDRLPANISNKILNIGEPEKAPMANTRFLPIYIGNDYLEYFSDEAALKFYANFKGLDPKTYEVGGGPRTFEDTIARLDTPTPAFKVGEKVTWQSFGGDLPVEIVDGKINVGTDGHSYVMVKDKDGNLTGARVDQILGPKSKETATFGERKPLAEPAKAVDSGSGYYIKMYVPIAENDPLFKRLITEGIKTNEYGSKTPTSIWSRLLGGILSPEQTMSLYARQQRGIATFGPNVINKIATDLGKDLRNVVGFTRWSTKGKDLNKVMEYARTLPDPDRPGMLGYTFKNPGELEYAYRQVLSRSPDEQEVKGYFAWKFLGELDWTLRNLSVIRDKTRLGVMTHEINISDPQGVGNVKSPKFDAAPVPKDLIRGSGDDLVLLMGSKLGEEKIVSLKSIGANTDIGSILRTGKNKAGQFGRRLEISQLYDWRERPLEGWGNVKDENIKYVVGNFTKDNISFFQLPQRGGGHYIYEYPHYLRQGIVTQSLKTPAKLDKDGKEIAPAKYNSNYEGDNTLLAVPNRAMGKIVEERYNAFRELVRDGKLDEAKAYLQANPVGIDYKDFIKKFVPEPRVNSRTGRPMKPKPQIDLNEPIRLVDNNRTLGDVYGDEYRQRFGKSFVDATKTGNLANQSQVAFTGERDVRELMTIVDQGGKGNPIFKMEPAKLVDPMIAMNRSLRNISNSFFFDDLKVGYMDHWLQEAAPYMDLKKNELQNNGYSVFHNAPSKYKKKPSSEQADRIAQLENVRRQHLFLVSRPGEMESTLMSVAQNLADAIYTRLGPKFPINPMSIISMARDGPEFLRQMAFHFKLGLFNPSQFLKQLNTFATIYGIEGYERASQGGAAALMHEYSRINDNPEVIAHMDKILEKFGWRPGEYTEARNFFLNTGFDTVAGEYAARDSIWSGKIYKNGLDNFLSLGTSFFTEGERGGRYGAFYTAYRRFRDAHPTGALSDADKETILQRARLLNNNMDRAANAIWQHGLSSIPFQFQTYTLRLMDLMLGTQLTAGEKARLFGTYFTLYGFPVATGLVGLPIADNLRQLAIDHGDYHVGDNYIQDTLMNGVPATLGGIISGHTYNIGQTFGPSGLFSFSEHLRGEASWWQALLSTSLGPSGSILVNSWANADGLYRWAANIYSGDFSFQWEDVVRLFKEISSVRGADQLRMALETANWYTSKGTLQASDIKPMDAIFMTLTGTSHQQMSDAFATGQNVESRKEYNQATEKLFIERWHKGILAAQQGPGYSPNQADQHFKDAGIILKMRNYPMEDYGKLYANGSKTYETLIDKMNKEYNLQHRPAGRGPEMTERYIRNIQQGNQ